MVAGSQLAVAQNSAPVQLPANARGAAAISALGSHLPTVAQAYGLSAQRLTTLLQTQPALGVDRDGLLNFVCEAPPASALAPQNATTATSSSSGTVSAATADALHLHSFPGAQRVIYLDFDGHTTSGTQWNKSFTGDSAIQSAPFDVDGSPSTFGSAERTLIYNIWQRVAEDYAGFAVDVTTEDPGLEALRKTSSSDSVFGVRVVISPTNWYNGGAGGVGYVGSFSWNSDTPCFVFSEQLANSEKYIAESAAHEAGHTLRLYHDGASGSSASEYYLGHGNWAPLMGAGYYRGVTQFSRGEYAYANNTEDDLSIISSNAPYATDDHGDSLSAASTLSGPSVADGGTIERSGDVDVFRFTADAGSISLSIQGPSPEPNLDIQAELLNGSGQVLQTSDPAGLNAAINASVSAGTYYLRIRGVGAGDPASTGYSNYGSIGNYVITGTLPSGTTTTTQQAPTAVATASTTSGPAPLTVAFSSQNSRDADGSIVSYRWDFGTGVTSTEPNPSYTYSAAGSFNATLTVTDNTGLTGTATVTITASSTTSGSNVAPTFTTQPVSQTVPSGGTARFSVAVSGSPSPTITWYRNGVTFAGWNGTSLTLEGVTSNDTGTYTAVATNSAGSVTSAPATLSIGTSSTPTNNNIAPSFTTQPASQTAAAGASVTFSAWASGSPAPTYQWRKNGVALSGATNATLTLSGISTNDGGDFTVVATNSAGSATSNVATLTVSSSTPTGAPTITTQPVSQSVYPGGTAIFSVGVTGSPAPTVQWYRNGITFPSFSGTTLTLYGVTANDIGTYTAVVSNSYGTVTSAPASLNVVGAAPLPAAQ